jgi:hypothetical protein
MEELRDKRDEDWLQVRQQYCHGSAWFGSSSCLSLLGQLRGFNMGAEDLTSLRQVTYIAGG